VRRRDTATAQLCSSSPIQSAQLIRQAFRDDMDSESRPSLSSSSKAVSEDRRFIVAHVTARGTSSPLPPLPRRHNVHPTALQTGALGAAVSYPAISKLLQDASALRLPHMLRSVGRLAAAGAPLGLACGALRLVGEPDWFVRSCAEDLRSDLDRVRLSLCMFTASIHIEPQRRLNTFTLVGACAGGVTTALMPTKHAGPLPSRIPGGGAFGGAAGFITFLVLGGRLDILNWYGVPVW
jgi:hypothetical protein